MPLLMDDKDIIADVTGLRSALIVPCNMCPAVTVAIKAQRPFMQMFKSLLTSAPFNEHIKALRRKLEEQGVKTKVFRSRLYYNWFMCLWMSGQRRKLQKRAQRFDAVIVLGCASATETVRDVVKSTDCKVIQGMEVVGVMNARPRFHGPGHISFDDCQIISLPQPHSDAGMPARGDRSPAHTRAGASAGGSAAEDADPAGVWARDSVGATK